MKRFLIDLVLIILLVVIGSSLLDEKEVQPIEQKIIEFESDVDKGKPYLNEEEYTSIQSVSVNKATQFAQKSSETIEQIVGVSVELVTSIFKAIIE